MVMERLQILISAEQRQWLDRECARQGRPMTSVIRDALDAARGVRPAHVRMAAFDRAMSRVAAPAFTFEEMEAVLESRYQDF